MMEAAPTKRRFTVQEYYCMGKAGILRPDERTELINGEVYIMPPIGPGHAEGNSRVERMFYRRLADRAIVRSQSPIHLPDDSEPEPDVALVRPRPEGYGTRHPEPSDIFLVVEVANTTLRHDREVKLPLYAAAGIPETWLMDLSNARIEVHRDPSPDGYHSITIVPREGVLRPLAFPDISIPCAELLP